VAMYSPTSEMGAPSRKPLSGSSKTASSGTIFASSARRAGMSHCQWQTVSSREAVSIGLIVTEGVINALKHAFPEDERRAHRRRL